MGLSDCVMLVNKDIHCVISCVYILTRFIKKNCTVVSSIQMASLKK